MENKNLLMPANYAVVEEDEFVYLTGGELSDWQVKILLGSMSVVISSLLLMPEILDFVFSPILEPISNWLDKTTDSILNGIKNFFS